MLRDTYGSFDVGREVVGFHMLYLSLVFVL